MNSRWARGWHVLTFVVAAFALTLQTVLVVQGSAILNVEDPPTMGERLIRLVSYFTIQCNLVVALSVVPLIRNPHHDGSGWRILRLDAIAGITVTGLVHWFLLRGLLDLDGWDYAADRLLHLVVPLLALIGWLFFGPRPRIDLGVVLKAIIWPMAWLAYILVLGPIIDWYPYPFVDVDKHGYGIVLLNCLGVTILFLACFFGARYADRALPPTGSHEPVA